MQFTDIDWERSPFQPEEHHSDVSEEEFKPESELMATASRKIRQGTQIQKIKKNDAVKYTRAVREIALKKIEEWDDLSTQTKDVIKQLFDSFKSKERPGKKLLAPILCPFDEKLFEKTPLEKVLRKVGERKVKMACYEFRNRFKNFLDRITKRQLGQLLKEVFRPTLNNRLTQQNFKEFRNYFFRTIKGKFKKRTNLKIEQNYASDEESFHPPSQTEGIVRMQEDKRQNTISEDNLSQLCDVEELANLHKKDNGKEQMKQIDILVANPSTLNYLEANINCQFDI